MFIHDDDPHRRLGGVLAALAVALLIVALQDFELVAIAEAFIH